MTSSGTALMAVLLAAAAAALATGPSPPGARARHLLAAAARGHAGGMGLPLTRARPGPEVLRSGAAALAGFGLALVLGGVVGAILGVLATVAVRHGLAQLEPAEDRRRRERVAADLPLVADLLAAGVAGGAAVDEVALVVAQAVGGPLGDGLRAVVAATRLGADPAAAWRALGNELGPAPSPWSTQPHEQAARSFGRAVARALDSGAPVAAALQRIAADARARRLGEAEVAARRVGVYAVGPLACCFLPAFVLLGVVPVVASVAAAVLAPLR